MIFEAIEKEVSTTKAAYLDLYHKTIINCCLMNSAYSRTVKIEPKHEYRFEVKQNNALFLMVSFVQGKPSPLFFRTN